MTFTFGSSIDSYNHVLTYDVEIKDNSNNVVHSINDLNSLWFELNTYTLENGIYTVSITAKDSYGVTSSPLTFQITVYNPVETSTNPIETSTSPIQTSTIPIETSTNPIESSTNPTNPSTTTESGTGSNDTSAPPITNSTPFGSVLFILIGLVTFIFIRRK